MADHKVIIHDNEFDVAIFCALYKEAKAVIDVFCSFDGQVEQKTDDLIQRNYFWCKIQGASGKDLKIYLTWLPKFGPVEMVSHGEKVLDKHPDFRFLLMTGICAGDRDKVHLGDLVIARGAYAFDAGKARIVNGRYDLDPDPDLKSIHNSILQPLLAFDSWESLVAKETRPVSKGEQRHALLRKLLKTKSFSKIPRDWLKEHVPAWPQALKELKEAKPPIVDSRNRLVRIEAAKARVTEEQGFQGPKECHKHICEVASTVAVREDSPFEEVRHAVRNTLAIDMEGHAFYKLAQEHGKPALFVKGVCDYADRDKDDSYQEYAARVSAIFAFEYIRKFVSKTASFPQSQPPVAVAEPFHTTPNRVIERNANAPGAAHDVLFWHTVNDRIKDGKDAGSLIDKCQKHVLITGISLSYLIHYCRAQLLAAIDRSVLVCIILPEDTPASLRYYQRYAQYASDNLPVAHKAYHLFSTELTAAQRQFYVFLSTSIPLTHSIGLYDWGCYVNEFCIDYSSSYCPSFSPPQGSPTYQVMVTELRKLIAEGKIVCGDGEGEMRKMFGPTVHG
jgi:nucleoside phosphorylase